jgi:hypothetical protein
MRRSTFLKFSILAATLWIAGYALTSATGQLVSKQSTGPFVIADGPEPVPPVLGVDGPEPVPPVLVADGPEPVPPNVLLVADGPEPVPPVLVADGPEPVPPLRVRFVESTLLVA